ncbi:MAG TPA: PQQ-binding-like beta-propeller repeat protein [Gemmataceae bacterium]|nr:PQQ-binding-like beta-propeller repeat protein [Gemmataceae bacterium]
MQALALSLIVWSGPTPTPTDVWPEWRGPTGDNHVPGPALPTKWSKTENVVWKAPFPGWGNSTPAIWKDAIFLTTQDNDRLLFLRIDRLTGKTAWERQVGKGVPRRTGKQGNGMFRDEHNMASPSPVTDGKHVWVHYGNGDIACYDVDGDKKWSFNFIEKYGPYSIWWGHANSPVLVDDLLISVCMQDPLRGGKSYIVAHEKLTGKEKWYTLRDHGAKDEPADSYVTPIVYRHDGRVDIIVFGANVLDAYDAFTGKRLWLSKPFGGNRVISSATLADGTVYAIQGMKGVLYAVGPVKDVKDDITKTHVRWKVSGALPDASSPVVTNGLVFMVNNDGIAFCLDAASGKEHWKERLGDQHRATPLISGGNVYFVSKAGKATVIEAAKTLKIVHQCEMGEEVIASPAAAAGDLYIRTKGRLYRIGEKK